MDKNEILNELKILDDIGIPRESYTIVYGAALVLCGVKSNTNDIDINCNKLEFEKLEMKGFNSSLYRNSKIIHASDNIDLFTDGCELPEQIEIVNMYGYNVQSVNSVRREKLARGREKDVKDVIIIDNWLKYNQ